MSNVSKKVDEVSEEMWLQINPFNREMVEDYLSNQTHLSPKSIIGYTSGLRIYFWWVKENLNDKNCVEIKKKEFLRYLNWLSNRELSDSAIKFKKSCVSAFNKFIESYYEDEYPLFRNYVTAEMQVPKTGQVHEKKPLTPEEITFLCDELGKRGEYQKLAYILYSYSTGCRRAEARQLLKEVVNYEPIIRTVKVLDEHGTEVEAKSHSYKTHEIRCKGRSKAGKKRHFLFGQDAMDAIKKWLEVRGEDDCPYVFVVKNNDGQWEQVGETTFNQWCSGMFTNIMGRRIHPHLFRSSRATNLVVYDHRDIETAQKLLGHESSETTKCYIVKDDSSDAFEAFV